MIFSHDNRHACLRVRRNARLAQRLLGRTRSLRGRIPHRRIRGLLVGLHQHLLVLPRTGLLRPGNKQKFESNLEEGRLDHQQT